MIKKLKSRRFEKRILRFLYFNKYKSQRAIAKEMGIHRATVKRAIKRGR